MSDKESFQKGKSVRKRPPNQKLRVDIMKMLDELKEPQNGGFKGYDKSIIGLIKLVFVNSLMQRH
jgi:hypothetical protein